MNNVAIDLGKHTSDSCLIYCTWYINAAALETNSSRAGATVQGRWRGGWVWPTICWRHVRSLRVVASWAEIERSHEVGPHADESERQSRGLPYTFSSQLIFVSMAAETW